MTTTAKLSDTRYSATRINALGEKISTVGLYALKASTITVLGWIGAMKFTAYEAGAIEGLVASSPLTSWLYKVTSVQGASNFIGTTEIAVAALIVLGFKFPKAALLGALGAIGTFFVTASLLFTAPVTEASLGGFPALSVVPGQFLLKDLVLLAAAIFLAGQALQETAKS